MVKDVIQFVSLIILRYIMVYAVLYKFLANTIENSALLGCTVWIMVFITMVGSLEDILEHKSLETRVKKVFMGISKEELSKMLEEKE